MIIYNILKICLILVIRFLIMLIDMFYAIAIQFKIVFNISSYMINGIKIFFLVLVLDLKRSLSVLGSSRKI